MRFLLSAWHWLDDRFGFSDVLMPKLTHIVPRDARWWYVFGSATLCAFCVQIITGIALAMVYVPGGDAAYQSLEFITGTRLGSVVRGMHYYGATAMVMLAVIHMVQVFLHASYKFPRELNWMSGVVVLFAVLGMAFTGQLLRWDANGVWSVVVAAEMAGRAPYIGPEISHFILGNETVGGSTLTRFFAMHVFILPGIIFAGVGLHLALIFRHGIPEMPKVEQPVDPATYQEDYEARLQKSGVPFWPDAMWRDVMFLTFVVGVILGCSIFLGPPTLGTDPDPSNIHVNPMPDWYFWWYFAVLSMLPPDLETWIILGLPVVGFVGLFTLPLLFNKGHRAPSIRPRAVGAVVFGLTAFVVLTTYGYHCTGEGGLSPYHLRHGGDLVWQIGTGYFGCRNDDGTFDPDLFAEQAVHDSVKMIEIKISQGAKPGHGGVLPAAKITAEISRTRKVPMGIDCVSPPGHTAFDSPRRLCEYITQLRKLSGGKPVGFKLCIGHPTEFLAVCKAMLDAGILPDFIMVDGGEGGTGAAPMEFSDSLGSPLKGGLMFVHNALVAVNLRDKIKVAASGKVSSAFTIARNLAIGADWCNAARGFMMSVGCIQAQTCHTRASAH
ncbi:MAG: cytochrome b N-terminal domain-containing protein [Planctomycetaceae bacterium]|nr:cytochrome b N-terminal domain-containing protein [Planctomycetaceae bacterium]